jgi:hypothetical protein
MPTRHAKNRLKTLSRGIVPSSGNTSRKVRGMPDLEITTVEKTTIVAVDDSGQEFHIHVDETSLARLKRAATAASAVRVSPREIQALLRSGLSHAEVSAMTGASDEQLERYAGPVLAEREYVVTTAQTLPAFAHIETTSDDTTFGTIIAERLDSVEARERGWTSWKDDEGRWILKLTFSISGTERDARWIFDPKRAHVLPFNDEANKLSTPGTFETANIPALRAVPERLDVALAQSEAVENPVPEVVEAGQATSVLIEDTSDAIVTNIDSEDLLEALRRRRNSSEDAPAWLREDVSARTAPVDELFLDSLEFTVDDEADEAPSTSGPIYPLSSTGGHKRNRPTMPKWNDIVSETKSDDDLI